MKTSTYRWCEESLGHTFLLCQWCCDSLHVMELHFCNYYGLTMFLPLVLLIFVFLQPAVKLPAIKGYFHIHHDIRNTITYKVVSDASAVVILLIMVSLIPPYLFRVEQQTLHTTDG